jgi:replicative DNA helicase
VKDIDAFFQESLIPWDYGILEAQDYVNDVLAGKLKGWKTGISSVDNFIRFMPREYVVIAARAGTGKTALGVQLAENVARQMAERKSQGIIAIFSAEMDSRTLALRTACGLEGVSLWNLQTGKVARADGERVIERLATMLGGVFRVDQSPAPTLEHMVKQLEIYAEDTPIELVLFDYLELAGEIDKVENLRIAKISRGMKAIAKKFDTTTLALAQMNRDIENRAKKKPLLRDLMQGGEREPDRVIAIVRDEDDSTETQAHVIKNRNGPLGVAAMIFDESNMRFKSAVMETVDLND